MDSRLIRDLRAQRILDGFTEEEIAKLEPYLKKAEFLANEVIFQEDDVSTDLYLILEGEVNFIKWDPQALYQLPLGKLESGDMFGEMSFLDKTPRSTTIEAAKNTLVYKLSRTELEDALPAMQEVFTKIVLNIAKITIGRLRRANETRIKTLCSLLSEYYE